MIVEQLEHAEDRAGQAFLSRTTGRNFSVGLTLGRDAVTVTLAGDIDVAAVASLERLLSSLELITTRVCVEMQEVSFIDSSGLAPLIEASCRRRSAGLPNIVIGQCSARASRFLQLLDVKQRFLDADG